MNLDDLHKILSRGENTHTEFKEAAQKTPTSFYDTVVSFLNREGGTIVLGKENAAIFMELIGLDKSKLNAETIEAIEALELAPEFSEITNPDELFFQKGSSWSEKGVKLFDKRTLAILRLLSLCLIPQKRDDIMEILDFNSRDKLRELYFQPLRQENFIEQTVKSKPNSRVQRYVTTEKGRRFLGGFDI
jgi:ATP-dependent DNA helicase RecG